MWRFVLFGVLLVSSSTHVLAWTFRDVCSKVCWPKDEVCPSTRYPLVTAEETPGDRNLGTIRGIFFFANQSFISAGRACRPRLTWAAARSRWLAERFVTTYEHLAVLLSRVLRIRGMRPCLRLLETLAKKGESEDRKRRPSSSEERVFEEFSSRRE